MIAITNKEELIQLRRLKIGLVEEPAHLNLNWLASERWTVVAVESAGHFAEADAKHLAQAFRAIHCTEVFALATEDLTTISASGQEIGVARCDSIVETSERGLLEFSDACGPFNFVLVPGNRAAAVLCTVYDYYLIAGPASFVKLGVGGNIEAAWQRFEECAKHPVWEGRLLKIVNRYRNIKPLLS